MVDLEPKRPLCQRKWLLGEATHDAINAVLDEDGVNAFDLDERAGEGRAGLSNEMGKFQRAAVQKLLQRTQCFHAASSEVANGQTPATLLGVECFAHVVGELTPIGLCCRGAGGAAKAGAPSQPGGVECGCVAELRARTAVRATNAYVSLVRSHQQLGIRSCTANPSD